MYTTPSNLSAPPVRSAARFVACGAKNHDELVTSTLFRKQFDRIRIVRGRKLQIPLPIPPVRSRARYVAYGPRNHDKAGSLRTKLVISNLSVGNQSDARRSAAGNCNPQRIVQSPRRWLLEDFR